MQRHLEEKYTKLPERQRASRPPPQARSLLKSPSAIRQATSRTRIVVLCNEVEPFPLWGHQHSRSFSRPSTSSVRPESSRRLDRLNRLSILGATPPSAGCSQVGPVHHQRLTPGRHLSQEDQATTRSELGQ